MSGTRAVDVVRRFWWLIGAFVIVGALVTGLPSPQTVSTESVTRWTGSHTILVSSTSTEQFGGYLDPQQFNQIGPPPIASRKLNDVLHQHFIKELAKDERFTAGN